MIEILLTFKIVKKLIKTQKANEEMSYPSTPIKLKPHLEKQKEKLHKIISKNCHEPNRYLHAMRLGICHFKIRQLNKLGIKDITNENERRKGIKND